MHAEQTWVTNLRGRTQAVLYTEPSRLPPSLHHRRVSARRGVPASTHLPRDARCLSIHLRNGVGPRRTRGSAQSIFGGPCLVLRVRRVGGRNRFARSSSRSSTTSSALLWMTILTFATKVLSSSARRTPQLRAIRSASTRMASSRIALSASPPR